MSADLVDWELVAWFGGCVAAFILVLTVLGLCRASARDMPAKPAVEPEPEPGPEPVDPRTLCSALACRRAATKAIHGYGLCDQHHAAIWAPRDVS